MQYLTASNAPPIITGDTLRILSTYAHYKNTGSSPRIHTILRSNTSGETLTLAITCISRKKIFYDAMAAKICRRRTLLYSEFHGTTTLPRVILSINRNLSSVSLNKIQDPSILKEASKGIYLLIKSLWKTERWRDASEILFDVSRRIDSRHSELLRERKDLNVHFSSL